MIVLLVAASAAAAGLLQSAWLASAARGRAGPASMFARIGLVLVVLPASAKCAHLMSAAAVWSASYVIGSWTSWRRLHRRGT